jgi:hypothetical protein
MASSQMAYTKITCVHYARNDLPGKLLAHASLLPVLLLCGQAAKVYTRRWAGAPRSRHGSLHERRTCFEIRWRSPFGLVKSRRLARVASYRPR